MTAQHAQNVLKGVWLYVKKERKADVTTGHVTKFQVKIYMF